MSDHNTFWVPGNIVKLKEPYRPEELMRSTLAIVEHLYDPELWKGFTYGIIAEVYGHSRHGIDHVSLFLYEPVLHLIYTDEAHSGIPTYVDFSTDECVPYKDSRVLGYDPITVREGGES